MRNKRLKYKKLLDAALKILSFLFFCGGAFLGEGSAMCAIIVMIYILMFFIFSYEKFNKWVLKGDNNEGNL